MLLLVDRMEISGGESVFVGSAQHLARGIHRRSRLQKQPYALNVAAYGG